MAPTNKTLTRLHDLLAGSDVAVVTMELQEGVIGDEALMGPLAEAVRANDVRSVVGQLCVSARRYGVPVVHCIAENRPDGLGSSDNCAVFAMNNRLRRETGNTPIDQGSPGSHLISEVGPEPTDLIVSRIHGLTPFTRTSLDQILRNMGVRTLIVVGVSLNIGVMGTVISAVDLGYNVILVRDGVCGVPQEYADAVLQHTMPLLATVVDSRDIESFWNGADRS